MVLKKCGRRQIKPYFNLHETKMMGPFKINIHSYGEKQNLDAINLKKENYDNIFREKNNLAALIRKNNDLVYARFNKKRNIDSNTILHGMSMAKTALATAIGSLFATEKLNH